MFIFNNETHLRNEVLLRGKKDHVTWCINKF